MAKRRGKAGRYRVWLTPHVHNARRRLPGNIRHRIRRLIDRLGEDPYLNASRRLKLPDEVPEVVRESWEVRRARLEGWRVVYAVSEKGREVGVLAVARRPPYRYEDLEDLLAALAQLSSASS